MAARARGFASLGGLEDAKETLWESAVLPLTRPELFARYGLKPPRGVLLHGPPGSGKTSLARAVAEEAGAKLYVVNGPEILSEYHGESEQKLVQIFEAARDTAPSLVFIDEIDAIAPARTEETEDITKRIVATLLTIMEGGEGSPLSQTPSKPKKGTSSSAQKSRGKGSPAGKGGGSTPGKSAGPEASLATSSGVQAPAVVVVAATNRVNALDPALRRPGRFDREIEIGVPSPEARHQILTHLLGAMAHALSTADVDALSATTHGFLAADLASLCSEAAMTCLRRHVGARQISTQGDDVSTTPSIRHRDTSGATLNGPLTPLQSGHSTSSSDPSNSMGSLSRGESLRDKGPLGPSPPSSNSRHERVSGAEIPSPLDSLTPQLESLTLSENGTPPAHPPRSVLPADSSTEPATGGPGGGGGASRRVGLCEAGLGASQPVPRGAVDSRHVAAGEAGTTSESCDSHLNHRSTSGLGVGTPGQDGGRPLAAEQMDGQANGVALGGLVLNATSAGSGAGSELSVTAADFRAARARIRPSAMREMLVEVPRVRWSDIGGNEAVKQALKEAVEWPQKHMADMRRIGAMPPKGILLYGPPGCSKTLLARAVATEAGLNFMSVKGPELLSKWVGESEKAVRSLFAKARQCAPSVIFFDEIDGLVTSRGSAGDSTRVGDRVLSQLLTEMDGLSPLLAVTVIAATNRPDLLDNALLRPGRFDRLVYVPPPATAEGRAEVFRIRLRGTPCGADVAVDELAGLTEGYTGADIAAVSREAALAALEENIESVCVERRHFTIALRRVRKSMSSVPEEVYKAFSFRTKGLFQM